jgi:ribosomal protein S18 acetylase RimI-like enzyme
MPIPAAERTIRLRPAGADDEGLMRAVYASTRADELALVSWSPEQKQAFVDSQFAAQTYAYTHNYPGAEFQVVEVDGAAAGRLYLHRQAEAILIMDVALLPAYRGQGIGTRLLREVLAEGRARGLPVTIHVEKFNPALRLYQRLGFREKADRGVYLFMEWQAGQADDAG